MFKPTTILFKTLSTTFKRSFNTMFGNSNNTKKLQSELEYANNLILDLKKSKKMLEDEIVDYRATISNFALAKQDYENRIGSLNKKLKAQNDSHAIQLKSMENDVQKRVNMALSSIGVSTFLNENNHNTSDDNKSPNERLTVFNSLNGPDKTEYYRKHKADIDKAIMQ